jgi:hypothetical protein
MVRLFPPCECERILEFVEAGPASPLCAAAPGSGTVVTPFACRLLNHCFLMLFTKENPKNGKVAVSLGIRLYDRISIDGGLAAPLVLFGKVHQFFHVPDVVCQACVHRRRETFYWLVRSTDQVILRKFCGTVWLSQSTDRRDLLEKSAISRLQMVTPSALPDVIHLETWIPLEVLAFGPFLALPTAFVSGLMLYVLGVNELQPTVVAAVAFYGTWEPLHGIFEHSHVRISFGWFNRIYGGAALHQIHHSAELRHRDKNLGNHLGIIWDWIFGTLYIPTNNEQYRWGLNDEEYGDNNPHLMVRDSYLEPFRYARSVLRGRRATEVTSTVSRTA